MKLFSTSIHRIFFISIAFILAVILISWFVLKDSQESDYPGCGTESNINFCGTKNSSSKASEGKTIFNSNCAACHKRYTNMIGPALSETDSIIFKRWFYNGGEIDTTKLEQLGIDYHRNLSKENIKDSDLEKLFEYIRY